MSSTEVQPRANIDRRTEESIVFVRIIMNGEVLGTELELGVSDLALIVVLEGELNLGEVVEELA